MHLRETLPRPMLDQATASPSGTGDSASSTLQAGSAAKRLAWLDAAKGMGIILVVYGHQLRAQMTSGAIDPSWHAPLQDALIYAFHMPLFFFIAGLTVERTFNKATARQFVTSRLVSLMYPYFLWSLVSLALAMAGHRFVNHQVGVDDVVAIAWRPVFQYWFLYALFVCQMLAFIVGMRHVVLTLITVAALTIPLDARNPVLIESMICFPFFATGILLSRKVIKSADGFAHGQLATCGVVSAAAFVALFFVRSAFHIDHTLFKFALAACGIAAVLALAIVLGGRSRLLVLLGATSMSIFVLHTIVQTAIRSGLNLLPWFNDNIIQLVCCVIGGVAVPIGIQRVLSIVGIGRQLGLSGPNYRRRA